MESASSKKTKKLRIGVEIYHKIKMTNAYEHHDISDPLTQEALQKALRKYPEV